MRLAPRKPAWLCRLMVRVGNRGQFLLLMGLLDVFIGYDFLHPSNAATALNNSYIARAIPIESYEASVWVWAFGWWMVAAFCIVNAFKHDDHWGFGMAISIKVAYVVAALFAVQAGLPNASRLIVIWSVIAAIVWRIARWPEPSRPIEELAAEIEATGEVPPPRDSGCGNA